MNSENKENLSNYQLLKREPSVCSTSLLFSKLITVVQFFFRVTPVLQWFQLNFGAGNFRGRRPGTSVLRMLLRLTAVKDVRANCFCASLLRTQIHMPRILVPRAHDPSGLWQGSRALAGPDFLSTRRAFVSFRILDQSDLMRSQ